MGAISSARIFRELLPLTVVGVAASLILFGVTFWLERSNAEDRFRELADQRIIAIRANIAIAEDSVDLLVGHFAVAPKGSTSREGFAMMVAEPLADHNFVQGFSWDPRVTAAELADYEERARRDGLTDFKITERDAEGKSKPVSPRDEYFPIYYMEPIAANMRALGFDLASHPVRRTALIAARDFGRPQATGRITLVQESGDQYGVLLLAPVFGSQGARDVESNRRNLTGFVSGVFRLGDLINFSGAGGQTAAKAAPLVDIHLFDMTAAEAERRLYPKSDPGDLHALSTGLHVEERVSVGGRSWLLIARPSAAFESANRPVASMVMLAVALLATGIYLAFLKGRVTQAAEATALARDMASAQRRLGEAQRMAKLASLEFDPASSSFMSGEGLDEIIGLEAGLAGGSLDLLLAKVHDGDRDRLARALAAAEPLDAEFRVLAGSECKVIHAKSGDGAESGRLLITLQDISARKSAEEERAAMIERIADSDRFEALGALAGGIAHEINTPTQYVGDNIAFLKEGVASLLGLAETARQAARGEAGWDLAAQKAEAVDLDFLASELPAAADQALDGTTRIAKIVQAIKEFSYPSSKTPHPIDVNHLIDVVATVTRNQWKYVAEMDFDLDPALPRVSAIEGEINQVLVNLMVNAAQAIAEQNRSELGRITVSTRDLGGEIEISVADDGPGISPDNLRHIFEMFFTTKAPGKGTGQGLAITKAIIHRHGGQITAESNPGAGARFRARLPLAAPETASSAQGG